MGFNGDCGICVGSYIKLLWPLLPVSALQSYPPLTLWFHGLLVLLPLPRNTGFSESFGTYPLLCVKWLDRPRGKLTGEKTKKYLGLFSLSFCSALRITAVSSFSFLCLCLCCHCSGGKKRKPWGFLPHILAHRTWPLTWSSGQKKVWVFFSSQFLLMGPAVQFGPSGHPQAKTRS